MHSVEDGLEFSWAWILGGVLRHGLPAEQLEEFVRNQVSVSWQVPPNAFQRQSILCHCQVADLPGDVSHADRRLSKPIVSLRVIEKSLSVVAGKDDLLDGKVYAGHSTFPFRCGRIPPD